MDELGWVNRVGNVGLGELGWESRVCMGLVPNPGINVRTDSSHRLGVTVEVPRAKSKLRTDSLW